jgi:transcriptional regulator with XRE-family HTH domain
MALIIRFDAPPTVDERRAAYRYACDSRGLSLTDGARKLGYGYNHVSLVLIGARGSTRARVKLADFIGMPVDELFCDPLPKDTHRPVPDNRRDAYKQACKAKEMSMHAGARHLGSSYNHLMRVLAGDRSSEQLRAKVADFVGMSIDELFCEPVGA